MYSTYSPYRGQTLYNCQNLLFYMELYIIFIEKRIFSVMLLENNLQTHIILEGVLNKEIEFLSQLPTNKFVGLS